MGRLYKEFLEGNKIYACCACKTHISDHNDLLSTAFQGRHGRAFLFDKVVNVLVGMKEDRELMTGRHTVADIFCSTCHIDLGWKYEFAFEEREKYKEGRFIIEKARVTVVE